MKKVYIVTKSKKYKSISLIEVMLAISLFTFVIMSILGLMSFLSKDTSLSVLRLKSYFLAEEASEILRDMRNDDWDLLDNGIHALEFDDVEREWNLIPDGEEIIDNQLSREIGISDYEGNSDIKEINIRVGLKNGQDFFVLNQILSKLND